MGRLTNNDYALLIILLGVAAAAWGSTPSAAEVGKLALAAGLTLLMQQRAPWTKNGGTTGVK